MLPAKQPGALVAIAAKWPLAKVGPKRIERDTDKGRGEPTPSRGPTPRTTPERKPPAPSKPEQERQKR